MCVWQSHAPAGMAKLTGVAGCEGSANVDPARDRAPAAIAPNTTSRLVVMMILLVGLRTLPLARRLQAGAIEATGVRGFASASKVILFWSGPPHPRGFPVRSRPSRHSPNPGFAGLGDAFVPWVL